MSEPGPEGTNRVTPAAAVAAAAATSPPPRFVSSTRASTSLSGSLDGKVDQGKQSPTLAVRSPPARSVKSAECCCWSGQEEDDGGSLFPAAGVAPAGPVLFVSRMVQLSAEWLKASWKMVTEGGDGRKQEGVGEGSEGKKKMLTERGRERPQIAVS